MTSSGPNSLPTLGFLTVRAYQELGLIGAYLLLNTAGRPREFHCTAPVRPNRAQEILYGNTLEPFLYGEQIGQTLVGRGKETPLFLCTDRLPVMALRPLIGQPLVWLPEPGSNDASVLAAPAAATRRRPALTVFTLGGYQAAVLEQQADDRDQVLQQWAPYAEEFDLREPFVRLAEAIDETQRGASRAAGNAA